MPIFIKIKFMGKVTGLGGVFIKAKDAKKLAAWYQDVLGVNFENQVYASLPLTGKGYNVLSFFKEDSDYFAPSTKEIMLNLRVEGLMELVEELRNKGVTIAGDPLDEEY